MPFGACIACDHHFVVADRPTQPPTCPRCDPPLRRVARIEAMDRLHRAGERPPFVEFPRALEEGSGLDWLGMEQEERQQARRAANARRIQALGKGQNPAARSHRMT
jgi:hypothetical protein